MLVPTSIPLMEVLSRNPAFLSLFCRMINFLALAISVGVIGVFTNSFQSPVKGTGNGAIKLSASSPQRSRWDEGDEGDENLSM